MLGSPPLTPPSKGGDLFPILAALCQPTLRSSPLLCRIAVPPSILAALCQPILAALDPRSPLSASLPRDPRRSLGIPLMVKQKLAAAHQTPEHIFDDLRFGLRSGRRQQGQELLALGLGGITRQAGEVDLIDKPRARHPLLPQLLQLVSRLSAACSLSLSVAPLERCRTWTIVGSSDLSHSQTIRRGLRPKVWRK